MSDPEIRIIALPRYARLGASSRYRFYQFFPWLRKEGLEIESVPLLDDNYVGSLYATGGHRPLQTARAYLKRLFRLLKHKNDEVVWLENEAFPWFPYCLEHLLMGRNTGYLVDYDDAVFHRYDEHRSRLVRFFLAKKIDRVMENASVVVAGNEYIAHRAREAGAARVTLLPTVVDLQRYSISPPPSNDVFTIGWIGTGVTASYLNVVHSALRQVCRDGAARLVAIGSGPLELDGVPLQVKPWSEETEVRDLQQCDVGIMPLPDSSVERGKCGLKLLQYMACGRPTVGSPVGVNKVIIEHRVDGFQADSHESWVRALETLKQDAALRQRMGQAGREKVEQQYSLAVVAPKLASLLKEAVRVRTQRRR